MEERRIDTVPRLARARGWGLRSVTFQAKFTAIAVNLKRIAAITASFLPISPVFGFSLARRLPLSSFCHFQPYVLLIWGYFFGGLESSRVFPKNNIKLILTN